MYKQKHLYTDQPIDFHPLYSVLYLNGPKYTVIYTYTARLVGGCLATKVPPYFNDH